ncbi:MAG: cation diffusion facilitator family transporter [Chloroflexi bacterium]|nr:cation diffusion facilitator family transporter [Chloroflexota bacterium]
MTRHHDDGQVHEPGAPEAGQKLRLAFFLTVGVLAAELAGGVLSNSLALLSDAGHVFTDVLALGLAWFAAVQATRPATPRRTFGYHRTGILVALANALTLLAISLVITFEAIRRLQSPEPVNSILMVAIAALGLVANLYVALSLHQEPGENLNVRSALLHVIGDVLASAAVIVGAVIITFTGFYFVDPLLSVLIALIIVGGAWSIVLETINILMEGTPAGVNLNKLIQDIKDTPGVLDAHDLHVWSLAAGIHAMSGHVVIEDQALSESSQILENLSHMLAQKYGIDHATIQFEHRLCGLACTLFQNRLEP